MSKKKDGRLPGQVCLSAIVGHCYNKDRSMVAVADTTSEVKIYKVEGNDASKWELLDEIKGHDMAVMSVDWSHVTDKLLTCSEDRTAYVWQKKGSKWDAEMVVMGPSCTYAVTSCRWAPNGVKCACSTGSGYTYVCYRDEDEGYWMSKPAKGHKSSANAVAWMPGEEADNMLMATGGADCQLRVVSAYEKKVDGKKENPGKVGSTQASHMLGGWIHAVAFSPDANWLVAVSHDSSISFLDCSDGEYEKLQTIRLKGLPFLTAAFVSNDTCIAAGHDFTPFAFTLKDGKWELTGKWVEGAKMEEKKQSMSSKAMAMFQDQAKFGDGNVKKTAKTKHKSPITQIQVIKTGAAYSFSTSGLDGCIHIFTAGEVTPASK